MADYTKYLRLMKPQGNEYYNVENFNHNAELIDKETEKLNNAVTEIKNGATREKAGIVQLGTEEGKALEGMMLARIFGCVGYGGDIQEPGVKDVNYLYYDRNTRKMYKCLNQNSDVSANVANFIPLDNNSLLDRLENLITNDSYSFNIGNLTIQGGYGVSRGGFITFPKPFPNKCISVIATPSGGGVTETNQDTLVVFDGISESDRRYKFRAMAKDSTTQVRLNYIAIGY